MQPLLVGRVRGQQRHRPRQRRRHRLVAGDDHRHQLVAQPAGVQRPGVDRVEQQPEQVVAAPASRSAPVGDHAVRPRRPGRRRPAAAATARAWAASRAAAAAPGRRPAPAPRGRPAPAARRRRRRRCRTGCGRRPRGSTAAARPRRRRVTARPAGTSPASRAPAATDSRRDAGERAVRERRLHRPPPLAPVRAVAGEQPGAGDGRERAVLRRRLAPRRGARHEHVARTGRRADQQHGRAGQGERDVRRRTARAPRRRKPSGSRRIAGTRPDHVGRQRAVDVERGVPGVAPGRGTAHGSAQR